MASSNKIVTVLTPNGRRQNVKVTPNSTILQILEEVCKKQGFKPEEYDLKHHNNVLDVSSIIRFSGLPNNCQLEMCPITKIREESAVTLRVQLENGTNLQGNYFPNDNLWNILTQLCPNEIKIEANPVIVYMRQEVYGLEALKGTTLKSLGLTGGRAMLRLIHRKPEELRVQANVSAPIPSKPVEEKPYIRKYQKLSETKEKSPERKSDGNVMPKQENIPDTNKNETKNDIRTSTKENKLLINDFLKKEKAKKSQETQKIQKIEDVDNRMDEIVFLGERNALAFSLDMATTVPTELPDEFFDLTIKDAKKLLKDLKQKREELEETPLQTAALRNLEQNKKVLRNLNQYKKSVIRVQFPDRTVLQGTFKPLETIQNVKEFVSEFLEDSKSNFHLYTTPPKSILSSETTLVDADCVPSALIHFGIDEQIKENYRFLKQTLINQFASYSLASLVAIKSRASEKSVKPTEEIDDIDMQDLTKYSSQTKLTVDEEEDVNVGASTSRGAGTSTNTTSTVPDRMTTPQPQEKVPKWFKPPK